MKLIAVSCSQLEGEPVGSKVADDEITIVEYPTQLLESSSQCIAVAQRALLWVGMHKHSATRSSHGLI